MMAAPACAMGSPYYRTAPNRRIVDDRAYRQGYDEGLRDGESDARRGRSFDYARHDDYRDADDGYRGYGSREEYRQVYRQGLVEGYDNSYRRFARGGYGYPPASRYPDVGYGGPGGVGRYPVDGSPARQNGFRNGYDQGRKDARDHDRFDPIGSSRYRSGDHDYDRRYGSRDDYKREYRAAFQQGYEQGYREYRW